MEFGKTRVKRKPRTTSTSSHDKTLVPNEERKEKLVSLGFDENECDVIIETKDKEVHLPLNFLEMVSNDQNIQMADGKLYIDVFSEKLIKALLFYRQKYYTDNFELENIAEIEELIKVCTTFKLKVFQNYLIARLDKKYIDNAEYLNNDSLLILNIYRKNGFKENVQKMMCKGLGLRSLDQLLLPNYLALDKNLRFELLKDKVMECYKSKCLADNGGLRDLRFIFNFLDLIFYENRVPNLAVKNEFTEPIPFKVPPVDLGSISCKKDAKSCVTLIVENKEIHINSFVLTDNSPVFKAMLNSTFKEGQTQTIELPGKKFEDFVYFLQFLSPLCRRSIKNETDVVILAPLCQEYQIDWLADKIKTFICSPISNTKTILKYLSITETMNFGHGIEESVINLIKEPFQNVHMESEFLRLNQRLQILIARKLLWKIYLVNIDRRKGPLSSIIDHTILSIFDNQQQKYLLETRDKAHCDYVIRKQARPKEKVATSKRIKFDSPRELFSFSSDDDNDNNL
ncbi:uncharacterized protein [Clytia hemisphaerica]|uniref:BTB domain-containing protein n=1 Tax=Clytia hemisphaerica TaxID=252671 RepID=A0A7M5TZ45_9CNID